jgi:hypothetical protein
MSEGLQPLSRNLGWLRFSLWMMPTCMVVCSYLTILLVRGRYLLEILGVVCLAAVLFLAYWDALLNCQRKRIPADGHRADQIAGHMIYYVFLQLLIVPAMGMAVMFSLCALKLY